MKIGEVVTPFSGQIRQFLTIFFQPLQHTHYRLHTHALPLAYAVHRGIIILVPCDSPRTGTKVVCTTLWLGASSTTGLETRVLYSVSLDGSFYTSLYDLVEDCRLTARITNDLFTIKLERVAPKVIY